MCFISIQKVIDFFFRKNSSPRLSLATNVEHKCMKCEALICMVGQQINNEKVRIILIFHSHNWFKVRTLLRSHTIGYRELHFQID